MYRHAYASIEISNRQFYSNRDRVYRLSHSYFYKLNVISRDKIWRVICGVNSQIGNKILRKNTKKINSFSLDWLEQMLWIVVMKLSLHFWKILAFWVKQICKWGCWQIMYEEGYVVDAVEWIPFKRDHLNFFEFKRRIHGNFSLQIYNWWCLQCCVLCPWSVLLLFRFIWVYDQFSQKKFLIF